MGKSRTSPLAKTPSSAGGVARATGASAGTVVSGATGINAGFATASAGGVQAQNVDLSVSGAQLQTTSIQAVATSRNNANFKSTDSADYHQLYNGRQYYQNQTVSIDGKIAIQNYLSDATEPGSMYSMSQNMNHALQTGQKLTANQQFVYNNLNASMHNLGYNLTLTRYDHADAINGMLKSAGVNASYDKLTASQLNKALSGAVITQRSPVSTSYNDFSKAGSNPFTSRAVKIVYSAKAKAQGLMPGNGPGGNLGEMILSDKNSYKITKVAFDGRKARAKGTQSYTAKGVTLYVDVE